MNYNEFYNKITTGRKFRASLDPIKNEVWNNLVMFRNLSLENRVTKSVGLFSIAGFSRIIRNVFLRPVHLGAATAVVLISFFGAISFFNSKTVAEGSYEISLSESAPGLRPNHETFLKQWQLSAEKSFIQVSPDLKAKTFELDKFHLISVSSGKLSLSFAEKLRKPLLIMARSQAILITGTTVSVEVVGNETKVQLLEGSIEVFQAQLAGNQLKLSSPVMYKEPVSLKNNQASFTFFVDAALLNLFTRSHEAEKKKIAEVMATIQKLDAVDSAHGNTTAGSIVQRLSDLRSAESQMEIIRSNRLGTKAELAPFRPMYRFTLKSGRDIKAEMVTTEAERYIIRIDGNLSELPKAEVIRLEEL